MNRISVAMATYNGSKYIVEQLMSILTQSIRPVEVVIVDDASTDNTVALIRSLQIDHPIIQIYCNEKNLGPIGSFKRALTKCSGSYIALADQDDSWKLDKLEVCEREMGKFEDPDVPSMVYTDLEVMNTDGSFNAPSFWKLQGYRPDKVTFQDIVIGNVVTGCTIMMNTAMKAEVEKMPEGIAMHDHWMALIAFGIGKIQPVHEPTMKYRVHESSVTNKSKTTFLQRVSMFFTALTDAKGLYLHTNIKQAAAFLSLYHHQLPSSKLKQLKGIVALEQKSSLYRKLYIGYLKYLQF